MPVIIDEVIISVEVSNQVTDYAISAPPTTDDKQVIITACVEQVLDILQQKGETVSHDQSGNSDRLLIKAY